MGLESGHDPTLAAINKGADSRKMIEAGRRIREVGLFLSVTVLLGIGGVAHSQAHAKATGLVVSEMAPNQIGALTLMLLENTPLYRDALTGAFQLPDRQQLLQELKTLVENIHLDRVQFQTNHASNYLPINARLGRDKTEILTLITQVLAGGIKLTPDAMRAL
jgi:radical SAM superfamily enzyme